MPIDRRQRWAAFSVRAHRNLGALATDILLYDRIVLPVPEDDPEYERWVANVWEPGAIAKIAVQAGQLIVPVPWTSQLRAEWQSQWDALRYLGSEVAYGITGQIYASSPAAWNEIMAGLDPDQRPAERPNLIAGYQSEEEAQAALGLRSVSHETAMTPGTRPVDQAVALHIQRIVEEPSIPNPEEAFLTAIDLALDPRFQLARRALFDWEDDLYVDNWAADKVESALPGLEEEYRDAVRAKTRHTRRRVVATLLPKAAGWGAVALGHPHAKASVSKSLSLVLGHFVAMSPPGDPSTQPGAALSMIRAAYRRWEPLGAS